ncbi:MAG: cytidine deaminase [Clostridia bacterium]|nr:cytidine deaminase [Clostridia bacterium]
MRGEELVAYAREAMLNAYAPYSRHTVGAALLSATGDVYLGCNVENAAFGPSCCAERVALFKAVSEGEREFSAIAVVGGMEGRTDRPCAPCGVCRQALREFCDPESFLILLGYDDGYDEYTLGELLPESFGPENVK